MKKLSFILVLAFLLAGGAIGAMSAHSYAQGYGGYNYPPPPQNPYAVKQERKYLKEQRKQERKYQKDYEKSQRKQLKDWKKLQKEEQKHWKDMQKGGY